MNDLPLFRIAPALRDTVPRVPLGTFPTRLDSHELPDGRTLWVKRDDLSGAGYAGNKLRKLEFLLADARARGSGRLITAGATGSHHAFATAFHGAAAGMPVSLVLFPQSLNDHVRDMLLLDHAVGAELRWSSRMETVPFNLWRARYAHRADNPYMVAPGGSSDVGTLGYVNAALEFADQLRAGEMPVPSAIYVGTGTMGTAAGIAIGLAWAGLDIPVRAVRITARMLTNEHSLAALTRSTLKLLRTRGAAPPSAAEALAHVRIVHDQIGAGYGRPTEAGAAAHDLLARLDLETDPTYTAKTAAAVLAAAAADEPRPLFWHTLSRPLPRELIADVRPADLPAPFDAYASSR